MSKVITANTLKTGEVVFLGHAGWVSPIHDAVLYEDDDAITKAISAHGSPHHVVGIYTVEIQQENGCITPIHIREKIRAIGPEIMIISAWVTQPR